ncbi:succinate dehydrogenase assembly factor 2 [Alphaproteobacteria bacterium]|nr:succinate dehydrogenase assembly factor 2 [Alphaproteobacteria bacterium]
MSRHYRLYLLSQASHLSLSLASQLVFEKGQTMHFQKLALKRKLFMLSPAAPPAMPELSNRVRRLIYQASYTGMKETDLLLGHFAKMHLPHLNESDLTDFENLLEAGDPAIYAWVMGNAPLPEAYDTPVFRLIKRFKK